MRDPSKEAGKWVESTRPAREALKKRAGEQRKEEFKAAVNRAADKNKWSK